MTPFQLPKRIVLIVTLLIFLAAAAARAVTPEPPQTPQQPVVDLAGIIDSDKQSQLNALLRNLEQKTGTEFMILTVTSLDGEGIEPFALRMAERWKLGKKGKDNGMLLAVALNDKKYRFETGYGLEGLLPDSFLGTLGREQLRPFFRKGDYSTGILNTATIIAKRIAEDKNVALGEIPVLTRPPAAQINAEDDFDLQTILLIAAAIAVLFGMLNRGRQPSRGHGTHDSGYGSWYGGGFGGGGASGDWGGGGD